MITTWIPSITAILIGSILRSIDSSGVQPRSICAENCIKNFETLSTQCDDGNCGAVESIDQFFVTVTKKNALQEIRRTCRLFYKFEECMAKCSTPGQPVSSLGFNALKFICQKKDGFLKQQIVCMSDAIAAAKCEKDQRLATQRRSDSDKLEKSNRNTDPKEALRVTMDLCRAQHELVRCLMPVIGPKCGTFTINYLTEAVTTSIAVFNRNDILKIVADTCYGDILKNLPFLSYVPLNSESEAASETESATTADEKEPEASPLEANWGLDAIL